MALRHRLLGKAARLYWRLTRPRTLGVRALVLDPDDRVALVRYTYGAHWYLPGGGVKKKENFDAAIARELREEIAIAEFAVERILGVYHSMREFKDDHVVVFVVRVSDASALARADLLEIEEAAWFPLDALPEGTSPATLRRIDEYRAGATGTGDWISPAPSPPPDAPCSADKT
ncbi:MAG: NUDIX domain-containing protein [Pseudomonadota bacterium]